MFFKKNRTLVFVFLILLVLTTIYNCKNDTSEESFKVGLIIPLTGKWSDYGDQMKKGILLWKKHNENSKIKILFEDGEASPRKSLLALNKLANENVGVVISGFSSVMLTLGPVANAHEIVLINGGATNPDIKKSGKFVFNVIPDAEVEASYIANFILNSLNKKSCVIYWQNNDAGKGMMETYKNSFINNGGEIKSILSHQASQIDFKNDLTKIKQTNTKIVFVPTYAKQLGQIVRQAVEMGLKDIIWVGYAASETVDLLNIAGESANSRIIYSYYAYNLQSDSKGKSLNFGQEFKKVFHEKAGLYSATFYDAISIISDALRNQKSSPSEIQEYIYNLEKFNGVLGELTFGGSNYVSSGMRMKMVNGGKFIDFDRHLLLKN